MMTAARWPRISLLPSTPGSLPGSRTGAATSLPVLRAEGLSKIYPARPGDALGAGELQLFRDLDFEVGAGELVAIIGRSGAGKSSLLHLLAGLDRPTGGQVWIGEQELTRLSAEDAARMRNRAIGFVWQFHYLLPEFTALENVALPLLARGDRRPDALARAREWLRLVELETRAEHRSGELSGGEQGRVALARALVTEPRVLLADEPTGDLDEATADHLFGVLQGACRDHGLGVVLVTHNVELAHRCNRVLRLHEGRLVVA